MSTNIAATQNTLGANEKVYYAQQIVDAFNKSLEGNMCLSKIPIALNAQIGIYEQNLLDILDAVGTPITPATDITFTTPIDVTKFNNLEFIVTDDDTKLVGDPIFISNLKNRLKSQCIPCGANLPKLRIGDIFGDLLAQIKVFITSLENILGNLFPSYCHFLYFLSFLCIPDLVKILAMIIARILQLTSNLVIGTIAVNGFIMGILGTILGSLFDYVLNLLNFAVSPVTCLLDSLSQVLLKLPTKENIGRQLSEEEYKRLYGKDKTQSRDPVDIYRQKLDNQYQDILTLVHGEFEKAEDIIGEASDGIQQVFADLLGLKNYLQCENERTSSNITEKIVAIQELVQMANLIASLLRKKVTKATVDELCRYKGISRTDNTTDPLSVSDIADVISEVTENVVSVIQDDNGRDVGIIITPSADRVLDNQLSIYSCNIADFIRSNTLDQIITDVVPIAEAELLDPNNNLNDPKSNAGGIRPRVDIRNVNIADPNTIIFDVNGDTANNFGIIDAINVIYGYNPLQDKNELNYYSVVQPKTNENKITIAARNDSFSAISSNIGDKQFIISNNVLSGSSISKNTQIKCGSIENLKNNLELILEQI